jgi:hypothetical protein
VIELFEPINIRAFSGEYKIKIISDIVLLD